MSHRLVIAVCAAFVAIGGTADATTPHRSIGSPLSVERGKRAIIDYEGATPQLEGDWQTTVGRCWRVRRSIACRVALPFRVCNAGKCGTSVARWTTYAYRRGTTLIVKAPNEYRFEAEMVR